MNESVVSKKIISKLKAKGFHAEKFSVNYNAGVPDIFCTSKETGAFFIETKKVEKLPVRESSNCLKRGFSKLQKQKANTFIKNGTPVIGVIGIRFENKWIYKKVGLEGFVDKLSKEELFELEDFDFSKPIE